MDSLTGMDVRNTCYISRRRYIFILDIMTWAQLLVPQISIHNEADIPYMQVDSCRVL